MQDNFAEVHRRLRMAPLPGLAKAAAINGRWNRLEKTTGTKLDTTIRAFVERLGGSAPARGDHLCVAMDQPTPSGGEQSITAFFGFFEADDSYDISANYETQRGTSFEPFLPIASTPFGSLFCYQIQGSKCG